MLRSPRLQLQLRLIATHSHLPVRYLTLVQHRLHAVRVAGRQAAPLRCPTNQKGIKRSSLDSGNPDPPWRKSCPLLLQLLFVLWSKQTNQMPPFSVYLTAPILRYYLLIIGTFKHEENSLVFTLNRILRVTRSLLHCQLRQRLLMRLRQRRWTLPLMAL